MVILGGSGRDGEGSLTWAASLWGIWARMAGLQVCFCLDDLLGLAEGIGGSLEIRGCGGCPYRVVHFQGSA